MDGNMMKHPERINNMPVEIMNVKIRNTYLAKSRKNI